jgi:hypothetical protein
MPESTASSANDRVKLTTPALAAEYTGAAAIGYSAMRDARLTTTPP